MFCPTIYQRGFIPISFTFPTICLFFYKWILLHQKKVVDFGPFSHPESFWGLVFSLQGLSQKSLRTGYRRYHPGGQKKQKPPSSRAPLKKKVRWRRNFRRRFFHIGYIYIYICILYTSITKSPLSFRCDVWNFRGGIWGGSCWWGILRPSLSGGGCLTLAEKSTVWSINRFL